MHWSSQPIINHGQLGSARNVLYPLKHWGGSQEAPCGKRLRKHCVRKPKHGALNHRGSLEPTDGRRKVPLAGIPRPLNFGAPEYGRNSTIWTISKAKEHNLIHQRDRVPYPSQTAQSVLAYYTGNATCYENRLLLCARSCGFPARRGPDSNSQPSGEYPRDPARSKGGGRH